MLGLFSGCVPIGGIQASGRLAWQAITAEGKGSDYRLCYGDPGPTRVTAEGVHTSSKLRSILAAVRTHDEASPVLVWHVAMLKLVPFLRLSHAPIVLFLHGTEAWSRQSWLVRRVMRRVDVFLTGSTYSWHRFLESNPSFAGTPHQTVQLGIGAPMQGAAPPPGPKPAALMLSRLSLGEDYKGHREVLAAWPSVRRAIPEAELWIAGDGDLRPDLEGLASRLAPSDGIHFHGAVSEEEKQTLIARSRCLVLPSRGEGFGLVYAEAMRSARPCLVSTTDSGREVVQPPTCGLSVNPSDSSELASALQRMLSSGPEWNQWSQTARQRYEDHFTAAHFQKRLLQALDRATDLARP